MYSLSFFGLAVFCHVPPTIDITTCSSNASQVHPDPTNGLFPYDTAIEYSCLDDRKFLDGMQTKVVLCANRGQWSEDNLICDCKLLDRVALFLT